MTFQPNCLATGIGSLPHPKAEDAVRLILSHVPDAPFWPQLPARGLNEQMEVQYNEGLPRVVIDRAKERISLGLKQAQPDPWEHTLESYPLNQRVIGRVVSITDYGAFVELEPGVEWLIHVSEMTWSRRLKHPSKVVRVGDQVQLCHRQKQQAARQHHRPVLGELPRPVLRCGVAFMMVFVPGDLRQKQHTQLQG